MAKTSTGVLALGLLLLCLTSSSLGSRVLLQSLTSVPTGGNGGTFSATPGGGARSTNSGTTSNSGAGNGINSGAGNGTEVTNTARPFGGGGGGLIQASLGSSNGFNCVTAACARG
ncbi:hypothetical protein WJX75_006069 [Coccomyxa subellipsoidea]|uniref:Uncharacterized protein n=1 Tax=Coccomyxa subellipsoidea TaxID=248742 RepID=A0ABR2Z3Z6_9CHLO